MSQSPAPALSRRNAALSATVSSPLVGPEETFPRLLLEHARVRGGRTAIREKDLGIWLSWTWAQVADEVRAIAGGLAARGFRRGQTIAIIGDNRPRLYWTMMAAQCLGGVAGFADHLQAGVLL